MLALLWSIADGPLLKEDLEIVSNYIKILKMDAASQIQTDKAPEELFDNEIKTPRDIV